MNFIDYKVPFNATRANYIKLHWNKIHYAAIGAEYTAPARTKRERHKPFFLLDRAKLRHPGTYYISTSICSQLCLSYFLYCTVTQ